MLGWDAACGGNVRAIEVAGAAVYVGGYFSIIHSVPRSNLAAIDEISGAALSWAPSTNATVEELMASGSTVYVGGQFSTVNGITRNRAAAVDAGTGTLTAFNPNVDTFGFTTVRTFAISGSTVHGRTVHDRSWSGADRHCGGERRQAPCCPGTRFATARSTRSHTSRGVSSRRHSSSLEERSRTSAGSFETISRC